MTTYGNTTKYALRKLLGSNLISDVDAGFAALADDVDSKFAGYSAGPIASRPTSTSGTPGIAGRRYRATDTAQEFIDTGTSWIEIRENGPRLRARRAVVQSIPNNAWTDVTFDTSDYGGVTVPNAYVTVSKAGVYAVKAWGFFAANATGLRGIEIVRQGSPGFADDEAVDDMRAGLSGAQTRLALSVDVLCGAGDRIRLRAFQTSGGALDVTAPTVAVAFLMP